MPSRFSPRDAWRRLTSLLRRPELEERLAEEVRFHLEMEAEKHRRMGMDVDAARREALVRLGGRERWKEAARDETRSRPLEDFVQDIRYAARTLRHAPAFSLTAILTLAVGIGANTAIFSAVDGVLFKPLPFGDPSRIVTLWRSEARKGVTKGDVAPGTFLDWRERAHGFTSLAAAEPYSVDLDTPDGPEMTIRSDWRCW
jgi:hypothetical protein